MAKGPQFLDQETVKVHLTPAAEADVREIYDWYEVQGQGLATEFKRALDACLGRIGRNPNAHAEVHGHTRRALLRRFPYCVFYETQELAVVVHGVFHGHRDPTVWQRRHDA